MTLFAKLNHFIPLYIFNCKLFIYSLSEQNTIVNYDSETDKFSTFFDNFKKELKPKFNKDTLNFAKEFPITTYGRIDGRIKCKNNTLSKDVLQNPLSLDDFYFVEINSMPTIELNDSFDMAFKTALSYNKCSMHRPVKQYCKIVKHASMIGYVLSSSIIALTKAKFQNQTDSNHN